MTPDGRIGAELDRRLARASRAFGALCCVFDDQQLSLRTRRMVYLVCVVSLLLYGTECWPILRRDEHRLDAFHHQCLRILLGVSRWDQELQHISNGELRKRWGDSDLLFDVLRRRRLQWLGHAARMPSERLPKQVLFGWLSKTWPAHGPRLRWRGRVHADFRALSISNWYMLAQDQRGWWNSCQAQAEISTPTSPVDCDECDRSFRGISDMARHKCTSTCRLPVSEQPVRQGVLVVVDGFGVLADALFTDVEYLMLIRYWCPRHSLFVSRLRLHSAVRVIVRCVGVVFVFWPYFNSSVASPCSPLQKLQCCVKCVHFVVCTKSVKYWSRIKSLSLVTLIFAFAVYCFSGRTSRSHRLSSIKFH